MAAFEFQALDTKGKQRKGVLEGDTPRQIRQQLREKGLIPVAVEPVAERHRKEQTQRVHLRRGVSASELALLTRQISTLVRAALPVEEALRAVAEQCEKPRLKSMMLAVRAKVVEGHTLADGLAEFPKVFDDLYRSMVSAGEKSGHLDNVLERLADYTERRQEMRQKIQGAMVYPMMLIFMAVGVIAFLLAFVVPRIVGQFTKVDMELPTPTRVLIGVSDFVAAYWWLMLLVIVGIVFLTRWLLKKPEIKLSWHKRLLNMPLVGKVSRGLNTARFAKTLSILNSSGVPLLEAMRIAGEVIGNHELRRAVAEATVKVREGTSLRAALHQTGYFPPMMLHMIASGESSGELDQMLERAATNQDREFESMVTMGMSLFEPTLILLMGGTVLFIVLAVLLPIFEMSNLVNQ